MRPGVKSGKQPMRPKPTGTPTTAAGATRVNGAAPVTTAGGGKKKKKRKGRVNSIGDMDAAVTTQHVLDDDDDDLPELEPSKAPGTFAHSRSRLSSDLEAVHLSTTASLNSLSEAARYGVEHLGANVNGPPAAHSEPFAELFRKVGYDTAAVVEEEMRKSLDALPGMRDFIRSAIAAMTNESDEGRERKLRSISQQILQRSTVVAQGTVKSDMFSQLGIDVLPESALTQALERLVTGKGGGTVSEETGQTTALHTNVVLSREFLDDEDVVFDDDIYSEDDLDERHGGVGHNHTDGSKAYAPGWNINGDAVGGVYCELEEEEEAAPPGAYPTEEIYPAERHGPPGKRYKNRRSRKEELMTNPTRTGTVTVPNPVPDSPPPTSNNIINSPMAPARTAPPPSSRAAGKQPMAYPPAAPTATTTTTSTAPPRSARAAAKAPAPPQTYSNHSHPHHNPSPPVSNASIPQKHRPPGGSGQGSANKSNSKIWSTNSSEERERIKEFWLGLSEKERRQLVEIEKETVLKRMKEQQKHSCTCAVCGRKRNAIEEELEVLYDAYYEELEQYANYQQRYASSGGTLPPPPGPGPFPGSVELDKDGLPVGPGKTHGHSHPRTKSANALTNGPKKDIVQDSELDEEDQDVEDYDDDEYDEEDDEEDEDEEDDVNGEDELEIRNRNRQAVRDRNRGGANGKTNGRDSLFNFGSSLAVAGPGNILTVADDLLKNDGQKFLEMMEQLAERRMQREEDATPYVEDDSEDEEDDEGDEGDEEDEDEDDEGDEDEALTEEQKIAEGKRMFSIFAARMFEQRVLQAYREKVAQERQRQLLRELEEEENAKSQREAKKQKENQKKKDKKRQQRMAKEEERAAKAAERAAEEAAQKERQRKLEEEQRKRREDEKAKREAARKVAEEERQRKEEERRKRMAEEKEQQAERERKRKEKEEKRKAEQKEREERERKAREEREAKLAAERAEKARKEQQEKEEREKRLTKEKEDKDKVERERQAKEQARTSAAKARPPSSPRVSSSASGSRQQQQQNAAPKKILNKSSTQPAIPAPVPTPPAQPIRQPSRPTVSTPQQTPVSQHPPASASAAVTSPTAATNGPPSTPTFPPGTTPGGLPQMVSPQRPPFPPQAGVPGYGQFMQPMSVPPPLGPSPMPRPPFGAPPFEAGFGRGLTPAAPIGPPPKVGIPSSLTSPILAPGAAVPNRRMSSAADPGPGPITRPTATIASIPPIARPNGINGDSSGSAPGSNSASPSRRSPSPKRPLGSSALAADDDEVVTAPPSRRGAPGPVGQVWHSPRSSVAAPAPWSNAPPGFSPSRSNLSGLGSLGGPWSQPPPPPFSVQGANLNDSWSPHPNTPYFGGSPFAPQNPHQAATPPPHSTGN